MQQQETPLQQPNALTRSDHIENLDFCGQQEEQDTHEEPEENASFGNLHNLDDADRFFDSRDYRVFFNCIHAKVCSFVVCTLILHEVIIGALYVLSMFEEPSEPRPTLFMLLVCRVVQMVSTAILYLGLWKHKKQYLLPFVVAQFTVGIFADISTLLMLIRQLEREDDFLLIFTENYKWLNVAIPLTFYFGLVALLVYILYACYNFLGARYAHDKKRRREKEAALTSNLHNGSGPTTNLLMHASREHQALDNRSNSPALPVLKTQNSIAMQSLTRLSSGSTKINPKSTRFTAAQLKLREQLLQQRNPTGSLQQLSTSNSSSAPQSFVAPTQNAAGANAKARRLVSLSNAAAYGRTPNFDRSEPILHLNPVPITKKL